MLTPSRMFYTATISVGELGVLFSLSVYVVSFVLRWFFYGGVLVVLVIVLLRVWSNGVSRDCSVSCLLGLRETLRLQASLGFQRFRCFFAVWVMACRGYRAYECFRIACES